MGHPFSKHYPRNHVDIGGAERDRTADLLVANEALSQLSYSPSPPQDSGSLSCSTHLRILRRLRVTAGIDTLKCISTERLRPLDADVVAAIHT